MISTSKVSKTVGQIALERKQIRLDLAFQRNEVWKLEDKSLLIHSLIQGFPVPDIYAVDQGDTYLWVLNGKQRTTAILGYIDGDYELAGNTPSVELDDEEYEIAGMSYENLPERLQQQLNNASIEFVQMRGMTDEQIEEAFIRLNRGVALKPIELTRAMAGADVIDFVKSIAAKPFFTDSVNFTSTMRNRFTDEELILQIMLLVANDGVGADIGGASIKQFVQDIRKTGISDKLAETIGMVTDYLGEAFPTVEGAKREVFLRKTHLPNLFIVAMKSLQMEIPPLKFGGWAQQFFDKQTGGTAYNNAAHGGNAKKENVQKRINVMMRDFEKHIEDAIMYQPRMPKPRGRQLSA